MQSTILLADDDIELSGLLKEYFESEGFDVRLAPDGTTLRSKRHENRDWTLLFSMS